MEFAPLPMRASATGLVAPKAWIPKLQMLVKVTMRRDDISEVEALLVRVAGDFVAGIVLRRLLLLMPLGKRKDGGIYKSDKAMSAELGVSYSQMARVRESLAEVLEIKVQKAQGSPTCHYWLKADVLVQKIAAVYEVSAMTVRVLIFEKPENGFSGKVRMDSQETLETITTIQTTKKTNVVVDIATLPAKVKKVFEVQLHPVAQMLAELGIASAIAEQYVDVDEAGLRRVIAVAKAKKAGRTLHGSVAGYVLGALKAGIAPVGEEQLETWADVIASAAGVIMLAPPPAEVPVLDEAMIDWGGTPRACSTLWDAAKNQLGLQLDKTTYADWVSRADYAGWADGVLRLSVKTEGEKAMCEGRLAKNIRRVVKDIFGRDVQINYSIRKGEHEHRTETYVSSG